MTSVLKVLLTFKTVVAFPAKQITTESNSTCQSQRQDNNPKEEVEANLDLQLNIIDDLMLKPLNLNQIMHVSILNWIEIQMLSNN